MHAEERAWITGELEREKQTQKAVKPLGIGQAHRNRDLVLLTLAAFFALTMLYGFGFWLPKIVQGLSRGAVLQVTFLTAIPVLAALPSMLMNGWYSDHSGERRWHAALSLLAAALLLVLSQSLDRNVSLAVVVLSGAAMGVYGYLPAFWSLPTTFLTEAAAAACIGLINSFGNLGGFVGNYAMGFLSDKTGSYAGGVAYLAGSAIVAAALVLSVRASRDRHKAGDSARTT